MQYFVSYLAFQFSKIGKATCGNIIFKIRQEALLSQIVSIKKAAKQN